MPELIATLKTHPEQLYDLDSRLFEELVAELLASHGWQVGLTPPSRDGGIDIMGVSTDSTGFETSWVVECKRYARGRPVGVEVVRQLFGVQQSLRVPRALLVTTSGVTAGAADFARRVEGVSVADVTVLQRWIDEYQVPETGVGRAESRTFKSCFVSFSYNDEQFVAALVSRLRESGVRVWFAPDDVAPGQKIHEEVFNAIDSFDRVILVLSESSMSSAWVKAELRRARKREIEDGIRILFPISLVPFDQVRAWSLFDADAGQDLAVELREYLIPDFSQWEDPSELDRRFQALLDALAIP